MKTMTMTFHKSCNYGAILQTYALQKVLLSMGHENVVLDYRKSKERPPDKTELSAILNMARRLALTLQDLLHGEKHKVLVEYFAEFHRKHLNLTEEFSSIEEIEAHCQDIDCFITGSDQVFNLRSLPEFRAAFLLQLGPEKCIRFSYAASLEKKDYTEKEKEEMRAVLKTYRGVSLREKSAKEYFESFAPDVKTTVVLDPVFLLAPSEWEALSTPPRIKGPYILVYQVQRNQRMQETVQALKKATGYPVVSICAGTIKWIHADHTYYDVSPEEFIGFYREAAIVVSASFHGAAFGLVFHKPTYALVREGTSSRIRDLMEKFGLDAYMIDADKPIKEWSVDEAALERAIQAERRKSMDFLREMLTNEDQD